MTVNPYLTQEYDPPAASPPQPCAAKSDTSSGRKTNRAAIAGGVLGVLVGLWLAEIPDLHGLSDYEFGSAMAHALVRAQVGAVAGYFPVWLFRLFFSRPGVASLILVGAVVGGGAFAVRRGLVSMDSIPLLGNGQASTDSISWTSRPVDLARHQEPRRVQFEDEPFSVILPPNWKRTADESGGIVFAGSTGAAFVGSLGLKAHPKTGRVTLEAIQNSAAKFTPGFVSLIDSGELTIDEKQAFFVACHVRRDRRNIRSVVYLVPGESRLYQLTVCCNEPPPASSRKTLSSVVTSVRVD